MEIQGPTFSFAALFSDHPPRPYKLRG